jgi:hypothetical protein
MIDLREPAPGWHPDQPLPPETAMSPIVTQRHLDECTRALGRPLDAFEFKVLEEMLLKLEAMNRKYLRKYHVEKTHSLDELVRVFVDRIAAKQAEAMSKRWVTP